MKDAAAAIGARLFGKESPERTWGWFDHPEPSPLKYLYNLFLFISPWDAPSDRRLLRIWFAIAPLVLWLDFRFWFLPAWRYALYSCLGPGDCALVPTMEWIRLATSILLAFAAAPAQFGVLFLILFAVLALQGLLDLARGGLRTLGIGDGKDG